MTSLAQDKKWQAESDARTLSEALIIEADGKRLKAAKTASKSLAKEAAVSAKTMGNVVNMNAYVPHKQFQS